MPDYPIGTPYPAWADTLRQKYPTIPPLVLTRYDWEEGPVWGRLYPGAEEFAESFPVGAAFWWQWKTGAESPLLAPWFNGDEQTWASMALEPYYAQQKTQVAQQVRDLGGTPTQVAAAVAAVTAAQAAGKAVSPTLPQKVVGVPQTVPPTPTPEYKIPTWVPIAGVIGGTIALALVLLLQKTGRRRLA